MSAERKFPGDMRLDVRLCSSVEGRLIKVAVHSLADSGAPPRPGTRWRARDALPLFVAGVDAGIFHGAKEGQHADVLNAQARTTDDGERIDEWELLMPPLEVEAFAVLARMFWTAGARAVALVQNAPEARLTVRGLNDPTRTKRVPPWEVVKPTEENAKDAVITVCFKADAPDSVVRATQATIKAWAAVVAFGGFTGPALPSSYALLSELGTELENEVSASFDALSVRHDGWAALWAGLSRIHKDAPIQRVEMR